jgi:hypothetical protein
MNEGEYKIVIDKDKLEGLKYCQNIVDVIHILSRDMPEELKPYCHITLARIEELAESLEIGWRKWLVNDFNRSLGDSPLLKPMRCIETNRKYFPDCDDL